MNAIALDYNANAGEGDVSFEGGSIKKADPLQTIIYTSLFCDAYADTSDLPAASDDRRGHWADAFLPDDESHGSLLWLLEREKTTANVVKRARDYAQRAVNWIATDVLVRAITVVAERYDNQTIALGVSVTRNTGEKNTFNFNVNL